MKYRAREGTARHNGVDGAGLARVGAIHYHGALESEDSQDQLEESNGHTPILAPRPYMYEF